MKKLIERYSEVNEKKKLDPVDKDELKGSHADRKDKDIDNDGDVDKSDEYLHNRRKTVKKAMAKESDVEMNPSKKKDKSTDMSAMEQTLPPVYSRILENRAMHMKGATPPEGMHDKSKSSKGAMDMLNTPKEIKDNPEADGADMKKAVSAAPSAAKRPGDKNQRDSMETPKDTTKAA